MEDDVNLSIAIDALNRKIAELNLKILENQNDEDQENLNKYLNIRQEIYKGNTSLIQKVIDGEI